MTENIGAQSTPEQLADTYAPEKESEDASRSSAQLETLQELWATIEPWQRFVRMLRSPSLLDGLERLQAEGVAWRHAFKVLSSEQEDLLYRLCINRSTNLTMVQSWVSRRQERMHEVTQAITRATAGADLDLQPIITKAEALIEDLASQGFSERVE